MSITREQVADLQPGDVVELICVRDWNVNVRGELRPFPMGQHPRASITGIVGLTLGPGLVVRRADGGVAAMWTDANYSLVIVSRTPRPLYVNHPRTEVKQHDVIRDGEGVIRHCDAAGFGGLPTWWSWNYEPGWKWTHTTCPPQPLTLLVDGETGRCVQ